MSESLKQDILNAVRDSKCARCCGLRAAAGIYDDAMTIKLTREQIQKIIAEYYRKR